MAVAFERARHARLAARTGSAAADTSTDNPRSAQPRRTERIACRGNAIRRTDMTALVNFIHSIRRNDEGQDLLEYALLVALIALGAVGAVTSVGQTVSSVFWDVIAAAIPD
jgi:Flp pilus assembly pilin Flp